MRISLKFGALEAALASRHEIASSKRTKFQARLRKLQTLGVPKGIGSGRGVAAHYGTAQIVETAIALELTELGLAPERLKKVIESSELEIAQAFYQSAGSLLQFPDVQAWDDPHEKLLHMFIYFDPNSLRALTDQEADEWDWASASMWRNGAADLRDYIVSLTQSTSRLALINITVLLGDLASIFPDQQRAAFLEEVREWAQQIENMPDADVEACLPQAEALALDLSEDLISVLYREYGPNPTKVLHANQPRPIAPIEVRDEAERLGLVKVRSADAERGDLLFTALGAAVGQVLRRRSVAPKEEE